MKNCDPEFWLSASVWRKDGATAAPVSKSLALIFAAGEAGPQASSETTPSLCMRSVAKSSLKTYHSAGRTLHRIFVSALVRCVSFCIFDDVNCVPLRSCVAVVSPAFSLTRLPLHWLTFDASNRAFHCSCNNRTLQLRHVDPVIQASFCRRHVVTRTPQEVLFRHQHAAGHPCR